MCQGGPEQLITLDKGFHKSLFTQNFSLLLHSLKLVVTCDDAVKHTFLHTLYMKDSVSQYDLHQSCWWVRPTQLIILDKDSPHSQRKKTAKAEAEISY